jgi:hypothetical protein
MGPPLSAHGAFVRCRSRRDAARGGLCRRRPCVMLETLKKQTPLTSHHLPHCDAFFLVTEEGRL